MGRNANCPRRPGAPKQRTKKEQRRTGGGRLWQRHGRACRADGRGGGCERLLPRCRDVRARKGRERKPVGNKVRQTGWPGYDRQTLPLRKRLTTKRTARRQQERRSPFSSLIFSAILERGPAFSFTDSSSLSRSEVVRRSLPVIFSARTTSASSSSTSTVSTSQRLSSAPASVLT